uniref:General transcription factor IIH subunit n=1 Tax=Odontella aurita TaxID=265563 RepID=A0A7S4MU47_9STRA|mmetsp:Transcript_32614/g.97430  ORF Transcript_32614/g.97430 Transcript_32614/m.97430 type:complete len:503 (+) Transcript_32614:57-1565(+)
MASTSERDLQHAWEDHDASSGWERAVREDEDGNIIGLSEAADPADLVRLRRKRLAKSDYARSGRRVVRDMIRYLFLVVDCSRAMTERDSALGPGKTRMDVILNLVADFTNEYYDQNPLSHLGIIAVRDGEAEMLTPLSGSRRAHGLALVAARDEINQSMASGKDGGEFSLQNGLEVAGRSLGHVPRHGSREVLVLAGALSTCDPGDVLVDTLPRLRAAGVRVSCVALAAEMHVCRKIAEETGGVVGVCMDREHLRDLVMGQCVPPPSRPGDGDSDGGDRGGRGKRMKRCDFVKMGFPTRESSAVPTLIHATRDKKLFAKTGYLCPRCKAKASELPTDCAVCGLKLVLAPHLARSFHHLFPVPPFAEVPEEVDVAPAGEGGMRAGTIPVPTPSAAVAIVSSSTVNSGGRIVDINDSLLVSSNDCDRCCYACLKPIGVRPLEVKASKKGRNSTAKQQRPGRPSGNPVETLRFQCPDCQNVFCADCDAFLHETLHNCPGCLCQIS